MFPARCPKHVFMMICGTTCFRPQSGNMFPPISVRTCLRLVVQNIYLQSFAAQHVSGPRLGTCCRQSLLQHVFGPGATTCLRRLAPKHVSGAGIRTHVYDGFGRTCFRPGRKNMFTTACSKTCFRTAGGNICSRGFRQQRVSCPEATTYVFDIFRRNMFPARNSQRLCSTVFAKTCFRPSGENICLRRFAREHVLAADARTHVSASS